MHIPYFQGEEEKKITRAYEAEIAKYNRGFLGFSDYQIYRKTGEFQPRSPLVFKDKCETQVNY
jgi:hypothetical protein